MNERKKEDTPPPPSIQDESNEHVATGATAATTATSGKYSKVQLVNGHEAACAIAKGDLVRLVAAFGCNVWGERPTEWRREAAGLTLPTLAAILHMVASTDDPVREPSGFRAARLVWRQLNLMDRWEWSAAFCAAIGIAAPAKPATIEPTPEPTA